MKKEEIYYIQWKEYRREITVPEDFAANVMADIQSQGPDETLGRTAGLTVFPSRLVQWSAAVGLGLVGLFRILYVAANLLRANSLMPY